MLKCRPYILRIDLYITEGFYAKRPRQTDYRSHCRLINRDRKNARALHRERKKKCIMTMKNLHLLTKLVI
jgi:hypothetical protein